MYININSKTTLSSFEGFSAVVNGAIVHNGGLDDYKVLGWRILRNNPDAIPSGLRKTGDAVFSNDDGTYVDMQWVTEPDPYYAERQVFDAAKDAFLGALVGIPAGATKTALVELGKAVLSIAKVLNNEVE